MQARKKASKMLIATKCDSDLPSKRKKREEKSNTLLVNLLIKEIVGMKLLEMVKSVEEKVKCGPPHPPPEQQIYFALSNWGTVKYKKEGSDFDETIICNCNKWLFFGDTVRKGKKK